MLIDIHERLLITNALSSSPSTSEIVDYYDSSKFEYQIYSASLTEIFMHYGLWDQTTRSHRDALRNEIRIVARAASLTDRDRVLDLGSGYGSTAVLLAKTIGCRVHGITLSNEQVQVSYALARKLRVDQLVTFEIMDYHHMNFEDSSFDAAIAIESLCHSDRKDQLLKEIHRVLKPRGRIAIADAYFQRAPDGLSERETAIAKTCFEGVRIPALSTLLDFRSFLVLAGFETITWEDATEAILPTSRLARRLGILLMPFGWLLARFGAHSLSPRHLRAFINQYHAFRQRIGVYGVFTGTAHKR